MTALPGRQKKKRGARRLPRSTHTRKTGEYSEAVTQLNSSVASHLGANRSADSSVVQPNIVEERIRHIAVAIVGSQEEKYFSFFPERAESIQRPLIAGAADNNHLSVCFVISKLLLRDAVVCAYASRIIQELNSVILVSREQQCAASSLGAGVDTRNNFGMRTHSDGTEWTKRLTRKTAGS